MSSSILVSLAVHENSDVVLQQIRNIKKYVPNSIVILHLANGFDFNEKVSDVYINPISLNTGFLDGSLLFVHLSNLKHAYEKNFNFEHVLFCGSNELFIKKGIDIFIEKYDCSSSWSRDQSTQIDDGFKRANLDKTLLSLLKKDQKILRKRAPEGTFYSKRLASREKIEKFWGCLSFKLFFLFYRVKVLSKVRGIVLNPLARLIVKFNVKSSIAIFGYAAEEFYIPSIFHEDNAVLSDSTCYINWEKNLTITENEVDKLRLSLNNKFSVKRVERKLDDPIRLYIENLDKVL